MRTLLNECGLKPKAKWLVAKGADRRIIHAAIPFGKVIDNVLVAFGQNGEALRPEQGYFLYPVIP